MTRLGGGREGRERGREGGEGRERGREGEGGKGENLDIGKKTTQTQASVPLT